MRKIMQRKTICKQYTPRSTYQSAANILYRYYVYPVQYVLVRVQCTKYNENEEDKNEKQKWNESLQFALCSMFNRAKSDFATNFFFLQLKWKSREPIIQHNETPLFIHALSHLTLKWWPNFGLVWCVEMIHTRTHSAPHTYLKGDYGIEVFDHIAKMSSMQIEMIFNTAKSAYCILHIVECSVLPAL